MPPRLTSLASLVPGAQIDLFKQLYCRDDLHLSDHDLNSICELCGISSQDDKNKVLNALDAEKEGTNWSFERIQAIKTSFIKDNPPYFALVNGREDEGHTHVRLKEEIKRKGYRFKEIWLDTVTLGNAGIQNFPVDEPFTALFLTNLEPLESDAAPVFLLKHALVRELESRFFTIPTSLADITARSKLDTLIRFSKASIATPETLVTSSISQGLQFVKKTHNRGQDVVIKPCTKGGGWAVGKISLGTEESRIVDILGKYKWWYGAGTLFLQEFIPNKGFDKRILILDGLVLGVEKRMASPGTESWIYNISKGATGEPSTLSGEERSLSLSAFTATGQYFSGIDLITDLGGKSFVLEVNSCPGFKGFETYLKLNVASFLLEYITFFGPANRTP
nr:hypothetical protein [Candidatus Sigynarchaeota archaeon]